jgi:Flp pilus assembly protein TadD
VFAALGEAEPSLADYRAFLARHERPSPEMALESAGAITAAGHPRESLLALDAVTRRIGAYPVIEQAALQLALSLEQFDDALRHIDALQRMAPRPEPWMAERAAVLARAGRRDEAREAWQALLRHIDALPTLRRGVRDMRRLADHARTQLAGLSEPEPVP